MYVCACMCVQKDLKMRKLFEKQIKEREKKIAERVRVLKTMVKHADVSKVYICTHTHTHTYIHVHENHE